MPKRNRTLADVASLRRALMAVVASVVISSVTSADVTVLDLATLTPGVDPLVRVLGPDNDSGGAFGLGGRGLPVAAGGDFDGDGIADYAVAHMRASPLGREQAGRVTIVFGNGSIGEQLDLAATSPRFLEIYGEGNLGAHEMTGSEIWMGDVTGDGLQDLLICRQNYTLAGRIGAGALTILVGGPELRDLADASEPIDLANPPASVRLFTLVGRQEFARLGIWARVGDVDGDGIQDVLVGADQEQDPGFLHNGAVYVILGGTHLDANEVVDLADFGNTSLEGNLARVVPPDGSLEFHFGATCQLADLDGNGRAEVMAAAALNRSGAAIGPYGGSQGSGGAPSGRLFIVWDDAFPTVPWPAGFLIELENLPAAMRTTISGQSVENDSFGEEILGGLDYSGDGLAELFVGDLVGDGLAGMRANSGLGYIFYDAATLKGLTFTIDSPPAGIEVTKVIGPREGAIAADTAGHGDFNGDGIADLMIGNPTDDPQGRNRAGTMTVLLGQVGPWPTIIDAAPGASPASVDLIEIHGVLGDGPPGDLGDTLCYSAAIADVDADGRADIVANEMRGNGAGPGAIDTGNLVVVSGILLDPPGPTPEFVRGDANVDGAYNIADAVFVLAHLFGGLGSSCDLSMDANADSALDLSDAVFMLSGIFSGGALPSPPFPTCGSIPAGVLGCASFVACP